jgi:hypothetical protein
MKTQYLTATSIDGFITDENGSLDWLFQFGGPGDALNEFMNAVGAVAMGSHTYEWLLENEIFKDPDKPKPWPVSAAGLGVHFAQFEESGKCKHQIHVGRRRDRASANGSGCR